MTESQTNGGEKTTLAYKAIPINKCRRNEGNRNSLLEQQSNNYYRQYLPIITKISE